MYLSPINSKTACVVWCALMLCAIGQEAILSSEDRLQLEEKIRKLSESSNSGDRLQADMTKRLLLEMDEKRNMGVPRRSISPELNAVDWRVINNLNAEDLAKMSLDDPVLQCAYAEVFMQAWGPFQNLEPSKELVLADMRRRGEAVSPMLLKLISENQETRIEDEILIKIGYLDTVRIDPFLEYARRLLRERTQTMTADSAGSAAYILGRFGMQEDEALLQWVLKERPYVAYTMNEALKVLRHRLAIAPVAPRPELRHIPSSNVEKGVRAANGMEDHPGESDSVTSGTKPWLIGGLVLVVLLGLYRVLCKGRRRNLT
jgi:hypothetical protein